MHTDTSRSADPPYARSQSVISGAKSPVYLPPGTSRVVPAPGRSLSRSPSGTSSSPLLVRTGAPPGDTVRSSYRGGPGWWQAAENTSIGPVTSRLCTPS